MKSPQASQSLQGRRRTQPGPSGSDSSPRGTKHRPQWARSKPQCHRSGCKSERSDRLCQQGKHQQQSGRSRWSHMKFRRSLPHQSSTPLFIFSTNKKRKVRGKIKRKKKNKNKNKKKKRHTSAHVVGIRSEGRRAGGHTVSSLQVISGGAGDTGTLGIASASAAGEITG